MATFRVNRTGEPLILVRLTKRRSACVSVGSHGQQIEMRIVRALIVPLFVVAMVVLGAPAAPFAQLGISVSVAAAAASGI
jgi:hypothetical protein